MPAARRPPRLRPLRGEVLHRPGTPPSAGWPPRAARDSGLWGNGASWAATTNWPDGGRSCRCRATTSSWPAPPGSARPGWRWSSCTWRSGSVSRRPGWQPTGPPRRSCDKEPVQRPHQLPGREPSRRRHLPGQDRRPGRGDRHPHGRHHHGREPRRSPHHRGPAADRVTPRRCRASTLEESQDTARSPTGHTGLHGIRARGVESGW